MDSMRVIYLGTPAHTFIVKILESGIIVCFAAYSEHVYSEYFQKSSDTIARQGKQATTHREKEPDVRQKEPSKGRKEITKPQREG